MKHLFFLVTFHFFLSCTNVETEKNVNKEIDKFTITNEIENNNSSKESSCEESCCSK